jgi:predicted HAD superfamily hydrolase
MKNILYYLEPATEMNDSLFRFATIKSLLLPQAKSLKDTNSDLVIKFIANKQIFNEIQKIDIDISNFEFILISDSEINSIYKDRVSVSTNLALKRDEISSKSMSNLILSKTKNFIPDVIIAYESPIPFLKDAFPNSLILNEMFGAFSRAPFPSLALLDARGIFLESSQVFYANKLNSETLTNSEKGVLFRFRRMMMKAIAQHCPFKSFIDDLYSKFDAILLVACQIDGYFAYNAYSPHKTQFDMVEYMLQNVPQNIGILVTEHGYKKQFTDEQIGYLKNNYPNCIFFDNKKNYPGVSQFLIPYIDGVASVSSSVAYQAVLWRKPYFSLGDSHVSPFAYSSKIDDFITRILQLGDSDKDNLLYNSIAYFNLGYKTHIFDGSKYHKLLDYMYQVHLQGKTLDLPKKKSVEEVQEMLIEHSRVWLLKQEMKDFSKDINVDHLRVGMSENIVVSFDLFDTLTERDFCEPHELFLFIEPKVQEFLKNKNFKFHYFRRQAEADTRRQTHGEFEVTIDQIYEKMAEITGLENDKIDVIKNMEISAELSLVQPKKKIIREYNFSKLLSKGRFVITDTYLSKTVIESILKKIGVTDYDEVYVSSETKTRKNNGSIFLEYLDKVNTLYKVGAERVFHIGDNELADGKMAKKHGINIYVFPKAMDNYKKSMIGNVMMPVHNQGAISSSLINGIFANRFYSAPWNKINKDSLFVADPYIYGYQVIGSLVLGFIQWLYRRASYFGLTDLYFLSRDGWILKKAYDYFYKDCDNAPKSHYLYSSRRATMVAAIRSRECVYELAMQNFNARPLSAFLENRFGLIWNSKIEDIAQKCGFSKNHIVSPYYEQAKLKKLLDNLYDIILENATQEKRGYLKYLDSIGFVKNSKNGKIALVDIGYSGSMQLYLKKILELDKLDGFYFLTHHHSRDFFQNDIFEGFLGNLDDHRISLRNPLNDYVFIFESALSSPEGSLLSVSSKKNGYKMNFMDAKEEISRRHLVMKIHKGVEDFVRSITDRFGNYRFDFEFSPMLSSGLMFKFASNPNKIDASMFLNCEVENNFGGGSVALIASSKVQNGNIIAENLIELSKWKQGAKAYYQLTTDKILTNEKTNASTPNISKQEASNAVVSIEKDSKNRKLAKLKKDPYMFFMDSKKPILKKCAFLFKPTHKFGNAMVAIIKKVV